LPLFPLSMRFAWPGFEREGATQDGGSRADWRAVHSWARSPRAAVRPSLEVLLMTRHRSGRTGRLRSNQGRLGFAPVWIFLLPWFVLAGSTGALAQAPTRLATRFYPDFSDTADALLRNAASHARDSQWAEAVDIYQRVIQQFGDKVARLPKDDPAAD